MYQVLGPLFLGASAVIVTISVFVAFFKSGNAMELAIVAIALAIIAYVADKTKQ